MINKIRRSASFSDLVLQTLRELSIQHSKLDLISSSLRKRDRDLFEICRSSLEKGQKERAIIYANEIAEIRKTLSVVTNTNLVLERVIARLETVKEICPTIKELSGVFGDVKGALKLLTKVMPVMAPEMDALNNVVAEILNTAQMSSIPSMEPIVIKDDSTEAIIQEAAKLVEVDVMSKIPEPPSVTEAINQVKIAKPMVAVTTGGIETYKAVAEESSLIGDHYSSSAPKNSNSLSEELVLDYVYRNNGKLEISQCAEELGISQNEVLNMLDLLSTKGKIKLER